MKKFALCVLIVLVAFATALAIDFSNWKSVESGAPAITLAVNPDFTKIWYNGNPLDVVTGQALGGGHPAFGVAWHGGDTWYATGDSGLIVDKADGTKKSYRQKDGLASDNVRVIFIRGDQCVVGSNIGISVTTLDANGDQTGWANALSVAIHQVLISPNGDVWAINYTNVYRFSSGNWVEYAQFQNPNFGAIDADGNFWVAFHRLAGVGRSDSSDAGLGKFDGQSWSEHLIVRDDPLKGNGVFGRIGIDRHNVLWFSGNGIGKVDLATMTEERIPAGTLDWAPVNPARPVNLLIDPEGEVMFSGEGKILWAPGSPGAVREPFVIARRPADSHLVVGLFDPLGRTIVNPKSFSFTAHSSGIFITRTENSTRSSKNLIVR